MRIFSNYGGDGDCVPGVPVNVDSYGSYGDDIGAELTSIETSIAAAGSTIVNQATQAATTAGQSGLMSLSGLIPFAALGVGLLFLWKTMNKPAA